MARSRQIGATRSNRQEFSGGCALVREMRIPPAIRAVIGQRKPPFRANFLQKPLAPCGVVWKDTSRDRERRNRRDRGKMAKARCTVTRYSDSHSSELVLLAARDTSGRVTLSEWQIKRVCTFAGENAVWRLNGLCVFRTAETNADGKSPHSRRRWLTATASGDGYALVCDQPNFV